MQSYWWRNILGSSSLNGVIFVKHVVVIHVWLFSVFYYLALFHVGHYTLWKIIAFIKELRLQSPYSSLITSFVTWAPECNVCLFVLNHVILLKLECFCLCRVCLHSICWILLKGYLSAEGIKNEYFRKVTQKSESPLGPAGSIITLFLILWQFNLAILINFPLLKINRENISIKK